MKHRKKKLHINPWSYYLFFILLIFLFFSTLRLFFTDGFHQKLVFPWRAPAMEVISGESAAFPAVSILETVIFPDQALVFLKYPPSTTLFTKDAINCIYLSPNSSQLKLMVSPMSIDGEYSGRQIIRCPLPPRGLITSVALKSNGNLPAGSTLRWDSLAYEALIDRDNTTLVFVKGLNLRSGKTSDQSKFKCVYGWDLKKPNFLLRSDVVSIAQEIVRCNTPLSILNNSPQMLSNGSLKVSVRVVGIRTLESIARPTRRFQSVQLGREQHEMCVCTMMRNQAKFLREWVMYHGKIGVQRWFIYDNNSDDDIENVINLLVVANYSVTRHVWPWIKSQEAGFAHCALRARDSCKWIGFIDVDEFFHLPSNLTLHDIVRNQSSDSKIGEIRVSCHTFGPSGLKQNPIQGVTVGYTCRTSGYERHKSIIRPEVLNSTLINAVHHFHLESGYEYTTMDTHVLVINHYKYQVWEVFKDKFHRRVATYVSDWQQDRNVRSKDRAPGLGTRAIEPPDWSTRFCEIKDTRLRDRVLETFGYPEIGLLPWQDVQ